MPRIFRKAWRFRVYMNAKLAWYAFYHNREWDHEYLLRLLIMKLTAMGLYFAKCGLVIDKDRKRQVHTCWYMRKQLLTYLSAFDRAYKEYKDNFESVFGFPDKTEIHSIPYEGNKEYGQLVFTRIYPEGTTDEVKADVDEYCKITHLWDRERHIETQALNNFTRAFKKYIGTLWD